MENNISLQSNGVTRNSKKWDYLSNLTAKIQQITRKLDIIMQERFNEFYNEGLIQYQRQIVPGNIGYFLSFP